MDIPQTKLVDGKRIPLTQEEKDAIVAEWTANKQKIDDKIAKETAVENQVISERADLPSWNAVATAIDNAFNAQQANIIKKIARPVYTYLKREVN